MNKRWMAITTFCLGMAAAPLGFQVNDALFNSADAQEGILVQDAHLIDDDDSFIVSGQASSDVTEKSSPVTETSVLVDQIQPSAKSGPDMGGYGIAFGDGLFFQLSENPVYSFKLTAPSTILSSGGDGVVATIPAMGPVPIALDLALPVKEGVRQTIMSEETLPSRGAGRGFHIKFVGGALNLSNEPMQPDLSKQFVELSNQLASLKLKKLHPQSLALEVETLKKNISDLEAASKLEEAQGQLKKIMQDYPESPAAQNARRMLDVIANNEPSAPGAPTHILTPTTAVPTPTFPTYEGNDNLGFPTQPSPQP